jgi:hypothetical protein
MSALLRLRPDLRGAANCRDVPKPDYTVANFIHMFEVETAFIGASTACLHFCGCVLGISAAIGETA